MTALRNHQPLLTETDVEQALEAMRAGNDVDGHPLTFFLDIQLRLQQPRLAPDPVVLQVVIFEYLTEIITAQLGQLRALYTLPAPDPTCADTLLAEDFKRGNAELEAWSLLYHRYVCVARGLGMQDIAARVYPDIRTLRRRHRLGVYRLTHELVLRERATRRREADQQLRLSLPAIVPPALVGAESALSVLSHILSEADPPYHILLHGPAGIGKTALALALAHHEIDHGDLDDLLWVDAGDLPVAPASLAYDLTIRLGLPLVDQTPPQRLLRAYLHTHRVLFVVDQAENVLANPALAEELLALLEAAQVVLTSRIKGPPRAWLYEVAVPELSRENALAFVETVTGHEPSLHSQDWIERFEALWGAVGGNPLALRVGMKIARDLPLSAALAQIDMNQLYRRIWDSLAPDARRVLLLSLLYPVQEGMPYSAAQTLLDLAQPAVDHALSVLVNMSLLVAHRFRETFIYTIPSVVRTFLLESLSAGLLISPDELASGVLLGCIGRLIPELAQLPQPRTALTVCQLAIRLGEEPAVCCRYAQSLTLQIMEAGLWPSWSEHLFALARNELPQECAAWLDRTLGAALRWMGQLENAARYLDHTLAAERALNSDRAATLIELAVVRRYQGRWQDAQRLADAALAIYAHEESEPGVERCIHELAQIALDAKRLDQALAWLSRLHAWTARSWGMFAQIYLLQDRLEDAREAAERALSLLPVHHPNRGRILATLGQVHAALDQPEAAVRCLLLAVDLLEQSKDMIGYARACSNLAVAYMKLPAGHDVAASPRHIHRLLTQALRIQEQVGDELGMAATRRNLDWFMTPGDEAEN